jgi:hypothetical protein
MRKIKLKRPEYVPFRRDVDVRLPVDAEYDRAQVSYERAKKVVDGVVYKCLIATARKLLEACGRFESDPTLTQLKEGLRRGVSPSDLIEIGSALRQFLSTVDTREVDFGHGTTEGSAEGHLVYAVQALLQAIEQASSENPDDAYRATVGCRASLAKLEG